MAALIVLALGEITQSARYYEYISRLAPPGQQGLYMGYAFLPIAIGYFIAGPLGGYLLHEFGDVLHRPQQMWWVVTAVGLVGAVLMVIYDKVFKPGSRAGDWRFGLWDKPRTGRRFDCGLPARHEGGPTYES